MSITHRESTGINQHVIHAWTYADATARLAAIGFLETDVGRVARQADTNAFYVLADHDPITWTVFGGGGSGGGGATGSFKAVDPTTGATVTVVVENGLITSIT